MVAEPTPEATTGQEFIVPLLTRATRGETMLVVDPAGQAMAVVGPPSLLAELERLREELEDWQDACAAATAKLAQLEAGEPFVPFNEECVRLAGLTPSADAAPEPAAVV